MIRFWFASGWCTCISLTGVLLLVLQDSGNGAFTRWRSSSTDQRQRYRVSLNHQHSTQVQSLSRGKCGAAYNYIYLTQSKPSVWKCVITIDFLNQGLTAAMLGSANLGPSILQCNWLLLSRTNTFKATEYCDSWSVGLFDVSCFMNSCSDFLHTFCV